MSNINNLPILEVEKTTITDECLNRIFDGVKWIHNEKTVYREAKVKVSTDVSVWIADKYYVGSGEVIVRDSIYLPTPSRRISFHETDNTTRIHTVSTYSIDEGIMEFIRQNERLTRAYIKTQYNIIQPILDNVDFLTSSST